MNIRIKILIFTAAILLCSCTNKKHIEDQNTHKSDTVKIFEKLESQEKSNNVDTLFLAKGNEPGWILLISKQKNKLAQFDLLLDYGEVHIKGETDITTKRGLTQLDSFKLINSQDTVLVQVNKEKCIDDAERIHATSVNLTYNKSSYNGCGD